MSEDRPEYLTDAIEMLGAGYDQPTVIVEPPTKRTERRDGKMVEVDFPAWVKFSTDFKKELTDLDEYSLKVFIYIGLSVNWHNGTAYPGIRKIAEDTGMNKDTVIKAVANLEEKGFLTVNRRKGAGNEYIPIRYIAIGTVRPDRTPMGGLSGGTEELSDENAKLSDASPVNLHNKNNKKEQEPLDLLDGILKYQKPVMTLQTAVEKFFPFNVNWETKFAKEWITWAQNEGVTWEQIKNAADTWRNDKRFNWQQPTLKLIFEKWPALNPQKFEPEDRVARIHAELERLAQ